MRLIIDENLPKTLTEELRKSGHDVVDLRDINKTGIPDEEVFSIANSEKRFIVTANYRHFANILLFPPKKFSCGIIVIKMPHQTMEKTVKRILKAIAYIKNKETEIYGSLIIIEFNRIRLRK